MKVRSHVLPVRTTFIVASDCSTAVESYMENTKSLESGGTPIIDIVNRAIDALCRAHKLSFRTVWTLHGRLDQTLGCFYSVDSWGFGGVDGLFLTEQRSTYEDIILNDICKALYRCTIPTTLTRQTRPQVIKEFISLIMSGPVSTFIPDHPSQISDAQEAACSIVGRFLSSKVTENDVEDLMVICGTLNESFTASLHGRSRFRDMFAEPSSDPSDFII